MAADPSSSAKMPKQDERPDSFRGPEFVAVGYVTDAKSYSHSAAVLDAQEDGRTAP